MKAMAQWINQDVQVNRAVLIVLAVWALCWVASNVLDVLL